MTTFDRPDALDAVLRSLARQSDRGFEVLVADDGLEPATAALVEQCEVRLGVSLPTCGTTIADFAPPKSAIARSCGSRGDYCVFLDGDCLARPDFVAVHRSLAERGWFVTGNRALMTPALTDAVLREHLEAEQWGLASWIGTGS